MNKYQEALDKICNRCFGDEPRKVLQELVDKEKPLTFEEVKQEWEVLGYEVKEDTDHFFFTKDVLSIISFKKSERVYYTNHRINRNVHKLITKTMHALGWI
jgi:hypothetical protein